MKSLSEDILVILGGIILFLLAWGVVVISWWAVGLFAMWVWSVTLGEPPMTGAACGLLLFTVRFILQLLIPSRT